MTVLNFLRGRAGQQEIGFTNTHKGRRTHVNCLAKKVSYSEQRLTRSLLLQGAKQGSPGFIFRFEFSLEKSSFGKLSERKQKMQRCCTPTSYDFSYSIRSCIRGPAMAGAQSACEPGRDLAEALQGENSTRVDFDTENRKRQQLPARSPPVAVRRAVNRSTQPGQAMLLRRHS